MFNSRYMEHAFASYNDLLDGHVRRLPGNVLLALLATGPDRLDFWTNVLLHTDRDLLDPRLARLLRMYGSVHSAADHLARRPHFVPTPL